MDTVRDSRAPASSLPGDGAIEQDVTSPTAAPISSPTDFCKLVLSCKDTSFPAPSDSSSPSTSFPSSPSDSSVPLSVFSSFPSDYPTLVPNSGPPSTFPIVSIPPFTSPSIPPSPYSKSVGIVSTSVLSLFITAGLFLLSIKFIRRAPVHQIRSNKESLIMFGFTLTPFAILFSILWGYGGMSLCIMFLLPVGLPIVSLRKVWRGFTGEEIPYELKTNSMYGDLSVDFFRIFLIGILQFTLVLLYGLGIWSAVYKENHDKTRIMYYCIGAFAQVAYVFGKDEWKRSHTRSIELWTAILFVFTDVKNPVSPTTKDYDAIRRKSKSELITRFIFDILLNTFGLTFIMLAIPVQVLSGAGTDTLGFVMGVVSAFFIVEIDDLQETKKYRFKYGRNDLHIEESILHLPQRIDEIEAI